jgi:hypothetical protein
LCADESHDVVIRWSVVGSELWWGDDVAVVARRKIGVPCGDVQKVAMRCERGEEEPVRG